MIFVGPFSVHFGSLWAFFGSPPSAHSLTYAPQNAPNFLLLSSIVSPTLGIVRPRQKKPIVNFLGRQDFLSWAEIMYLPWPGFCQLVSFIKGYGRYLLLKREKKEIFTLLSYRKGDLVYLSFSRHCKQQKVVF